MTAKENINLNQIFLMVEIKSTISKNPGLINPFHYVKTKIPFNGFTFQDVYDVAKKANCLVMLNSRNELVICPNIGFNEWFVGNIMFHNSFIFGFKLLMIKIIQNIINEIMKLDLSELKKVNQESYNKFIRNFITLIFSVGSFSVLIHTLIPMTIILGIFLIKFFVKFNKKWLTNIIIYWSNKKVELLNQTVDFN